MSPGRRAWLALSAVLLAGAVVVSLADPLRWDWQGAAVATQPWRAWTGALVHWSRLHLAMNLAGLAALAVLAWRAEVEPGDALAWAVAWPLTQCGLWLQPALTHYGGLSGVLHAGVAIVAWRLWRTPGRPRRIGALLAVAGVLKLISERPWAEATQAVDGWDFALAPGAHLSGAVAGLLCMALVLARPRRLSTREAP